MRDMGPLIVVSKLEERLNDPDLRLLDCRFDLMSPHAGREAWADGHIPGAVYADLDQDLAGAITEESGRHPLPDVGDLCETFGRLGIDSSTSVVVYDSGSGGIAARAWWLLRWLGHERVALLDGGIAAWQTQGGQIESGITSVETREFTGNSRDQIVITTAEIVASSDAVTGRLVDARDAARFRGESEPIDAVAGHIPGTRNLPFGESLDDAGHWKAEQDLQVLWTELLGEQPPKDWAVMCGSGVTACHLAVSACLAGLPEPRLYVGSWSEWIRDPARPVARGDSAIETVQNAAEPA